MSYLQIFTCLLFIPHLVYTQCGLNCSAPNLNQFDNSVKAEYDINSSNVSLGNAQLTLHRTFNGHAHPDENDINNSQTTGDIGIRLGLKDSYGPHDNMVATYSLSEDVCELEFTIWDIDQTDELIVETFRNGVPVSNSVSLGSCVNQNGSSLTPNGNACEVQVDGDTNHTAVFTVTDCIDEIRITSFDQGDGDGGSYTIVFGEACSDNCSAPDLSPWVGSHNAIYDINSNTVLIAGAQLTISRMFNGTAVPDENKISNSQTQGEVGIRLGVENAIGPANSMIVEYSFSEQICDFSFEVWDIDQGDEIVVEAFYEGNYVSYSIAEGSCVDSEDGFLMADGESCEIQVNGEISHRAIVSLDACVTSIRLTSYDRGVGDGGSYTVVLKEACSNAVNGGILTGGPFEFCVGDGEADFIPAGSITKIGDIGENSAWVITDDQGTILGLPAMPFAVDFDVAGDGTCLVWHLSFEDGLIGAEVGLNANDLVGCYSLSNPITVNRFQIDQVTLSGGPFEFCVGDGVSDQIPDGAISTSGFVGFGSNLWIVTDDQGTILEFPLSPFDVDFEGAGVGTCLIWFISFKPGLVGLQPGLNANDFDGCYSLSNPISVVRVDSGGVCGLSCEVEGGTLSGGPFTFCVGDGVADNIPVGAITLTGNSETNSQWVITDDQGIILGLPSMPSAVDFDVAGVGTCLVWHLSYEDGLSGAAVGLDANDLEGCFSLSNPISVMRMDSGEVCEGPCEADGGTLSGGPFTFCVGDGVADNIPVGAITLTGNSGTNSQWVITDDQGIILGLPSMPSAVDFDVAGVGTCLVWHLSFEDGLTGAQIGQSANNLGGCFSLSNPISVMRMDSGAVCEVPCEADGGTLTGGPFTFCVGDGVVDNIPAGAIALSGNSGSNSQWVITDDQGIILGLPSMPSEVDFDGSGVGTCLVWHLSYEDGLTGAQIGQSANNLGGCFSLSNPISVMRMDSGEVCEVPCEADGGTLTGGPFTFRVGDGIADNIPAGAIALSGNSGSNSQWVITDDQGIILGLPSMPTEVDFDGSGVGTCLVWHLSFEDGLSGAVVGQDANNLDGCFSLSNPISVFRVNPNGGDLLAISPIQLNRTVIANRASGTISVINSDSDQVEQTITLPNNGEPMYLVYSDINNTILVGDYNGRVVGYDGQNLNYKGNAIAGNGVFHMSLSPDNRQLWVNNEIDRTISIINPATFQTLSTFPIPTDLFNQGYKPHDVIIMPNNTAAFVSMIGPLDVDYVVKYNTTNFQEIDRVAVGNEPHLTLTDATPYLYVASQGTDELKILNRSDLSELSTLSVPNAHGLGMSPKGDYLYVGNISDGGANAIYTVDLTTNTFVGTPVNSPFATPRNYSVTADGQKLFITHSGLLSDQVSVYNLSPSPSFLTTVTVQNDPTGSVSYSYQEGVDEVEICAGNGQSDAFEVSLRNESGSNSAWVITDQSGTILAFPAGPPFDLESAGPGTCLIWHLSFEDGLTGAQIGLDVSGFQGFYSLSNPITVQRVQPEGGVLTGGPFEFCVGDGISDNIPMGAVSLTGEGGVNTQWVVTDDQGMILGLPDEPSAVDFEGAGSGTCLIWHLSYETALIGLAVGMNANDLDGCYSLSNPLFVIRNIAGPVCDPNCNVSGGVLTGGPFAFCVNDGIVDNIPMNAISLVGQNGPNSQWVVTDDQGVILGLPAMPNAVDFDEAGSGTCLVWHLSFEDGLLGAQIGQNANNLQGCFSLSNPISVMRDETGGACGPVCDVAGGLLSGGPFQFCVGDGMADNVPMGSISLSGNKGSNSQWVVTNDRGTILDLPSMPSLVDFEGAGAGSCFIWNLSYEDGIIGARIGANANNLQGCFSLSNAIEVVRNASGAVCNFECYARGGLLSGGSFEFCVGDGSADVIIGTQVSVSGNSGQNSQWVITDTLGVITNLPASLSDVNFDIAGSGVSLVWFLSYEDGLIGATIGMNANALQGCFALSNNLVVIRKNCGIDCPFERIVNENPIQAGTYAAFESLSSEGVVSAGDVNMTAKQCVTLNVGFEVQAGNVFAAYIEGCDNPDLETFKEDSKSK